jgi:hypothetical protein
MLREFMKEFRGLTDLDRRAYLQAQMSGTDAGDLILFAGQNQSVEPAAFCSLIIVQLSQLAFPLA